MLRSMGNRLLQIRLKRDEKTIKIIVSMLSLAIFLLFLNTLYLTYSLRGKAQEVNKTIVLPSPYPSLVTPTPLSPTIRQDVPVTPQQSQNTTQPLVKEYFIPLGSGTTQATTWTSVPGTEASVDFGSYKNIKQVLFEVSVANPNTNQQVWIQLFNNTDQHPVWNSQVTTQNQSDYLVSQPLVYDTGIKTYQVQMQTQLQGVTNLLQARIHIILN